MNVIFFGEGVIGMNVARVVNSKHKLSYIFTTESPFDLPEKNKKKIDLEKLTPVSFFAEKEGLKVKSIKKINEDVVDSIKFLKPDVIVVASFGLFIPSKVLSIPKFPAINFHPSELPRFRGAAPIIRAVEAGEDSISACVIEVSKKLDAGKIYARDSIKTEGMTSSKIYPVISKLGGEMILDVINNFINLNFYGEEQDELLVTWADKVAKEELKINFEEEATKVVRKIKAFDVCGGCFFILNNGERVKILDAEYVPDENINRVSISVGEGLIFCKNGAIKPTLVQREGKRTMEAKDFWNGLRGKIVNAI